VGFLFSEDDRNAFRTGADMIVMKFGGTSVEDGPAIERVAEIVGSRSAEDPVVVVSALARVTDQLLAAGQAAAGGDRDTALESIRAPLPTFSPAPTSPSFSPSWSPVSTSCKNS
jgi:aspartokinase